MMRVMRQRVRALRARRLRGLPLPDVVLAASVAAVALVQAALADPWTDTRWLLVPALALPAVAAATLAWRRVRPVASFVAGTGALATFDLVAYTATVADNVSMVGLYSVAAYAGRRQAVAGAVAQTAALLAVGWIDASLGRLVLEPPAYLGIGLVAVVPAVWGDQVRVARQARALALEEAVRAERRRRVEAELALARERARVVRDLHDVVTPHVNGIVRHAGVAQQQADDGSPAPVHQALVHIRDAGESALDGMRTLVGRLRTDEVRDRDG
jgi:signal transduction histidine kinase